MKRRQVVAGMLTPALAVLVSAVAGPPDRDEPNSLESPQLAAALARVRTAYQHSRYLAATAALPAVLASVRRRQTDTEDRWATALAADAYQVASGLLLKGGEPALAAVAAARAGDRGQAYDLLSAADRAGSRLGVDGNLRWTSFGPTNVIAHRVAVSVELGDAGSAVAHAAKIDLAALELPERRAMVLLDAARALAQWGKWERAFDAVHRAEREAPEEIRGRPAAHQLISELARRSPAPLRRRVHSYAQGLAVTV